jgi:hypothetical protein
MLSSPPLDLLEPTDKERDPADAASEAPVAILTDPVDVESDEPLRTKTSPDSPDCKRTDAAAPLETNTKPPSETPSPPNTDTEPPVDPEPPETDMKPAFKPETTLFEPADNEM